MKINLRNIVSAALERGIINGYLDIKSNPSIQDNDNESARDELAVGLLFDSVWKELDHFVDFNFDGDDDPPRNVAGFHGSTHAVSSTSLPSTSDEDAMDRLRQRRALRRGK